MPARTRLRMANVAALALLPLALGAGRATGQPPATVEQLVERGSGEFRQRRYFQAIESFREALELAGGETAEQVKRNLASAYGALGAEHFNAGESRLAEETFRKGLEYADNYYSHFGLGYLYFLRMDGDRALEHLETALELRGDFAGTHKLLALLDYRKGLTRRAIDRLEEARKLEPGDRETRALLKRWRTEASFIDEFVESSTAHFTLRSDPNVPAAHRHKLSSELERAYGELGKRLGVWPEDRIPVVLFTEKTFHEATGSYHWVGGMYDGQLKMPVPEDYLSSAESVARVREVILHEYAHALVRHVAPECPVWLNEGIAQHLEGEIDREKLHRLLWEGRTRRLAFSSLPSRLWAIDDVELARWSYLQGLGFVEFLVERFHEFRLQLLVEALAEEHSVSEAMRRTYGASLEALEEEWWRRVEEGAQGRAATNVGPSPADPAPLPAAGSGG